MLYISGTKIIFWLQTEREQLDPLFKNGVGLWTLNENKQLLKSVKN